jgi:hypothetical protein
VSETEPDVVTTIDLGALSARVESDEDDLLVLIHDGDVGVTLELGSGGGHAGERAILGAERLITVLLQFTDALRARAGMPVGLPLPIPLDRRSLPILWGANVIPMQNEPGA